MKTAIIGLGQIGGVHTEVLNELGANIVAVCDVDTKKFSNYSNCKQFIDWEEMLDEVKPDVVHVCTPHYLHADMVVGALERNINVICEKPLCIKEDDYERILLAEKNSKAQLGVCLQNRYNKSSIFLKEYLKDKKPNASWGMLAWYRNEDYYVSGEWRGKWQTEGGGVLINQAIHTIDMLQYVMGMPEKVVATCSNLTLDGVIEVEDTVTAIYYGSSRITFFATNGSKASFPIEILIRTDDEMIKVSDGKVISNGNLIFEDTDKRFYGKGCYGSGHKKLIEDFYDCVKNNKPFFINGEEGLKSVKMVLSAYKSNGKEVNV